MEMERTGNYEGIGRNWRELEITGGGGGAGGG